MPSQGNATPLHVAASKGHAEVVYTLLKAGADEHVVATGGALMGKKAAEVVCRSSSADRAQRARIEAMFQCM